MVSLIVRHSSIVVSDYKLGDSIPLEKGLTLWDSVYFKEKPIGYDYDEENKRLLIPRGMDINEVVQMLGRGRHINVAFNKEPDPHASARYKLLTEPRDNSQRKLISYLLGEGEFSALRNSSQLALDADTGVGKTYTVIAAMTFMKVKGMIITPNENIKLQWKKSFLEMTDIHEDFIVNIEGTSHIKKLMRMPVIKQKVFLINHRSIQSYAKSEGWEAVGEFFKKLQIGVKVYDEAHLEFSNLIKTDLYTNTKKTIYLTATLQRSGFKENQIFNEAFKCVPKYGKEATVNKQRNIIYTAILINSKPDYIAQSNVLGRHGFDRNAYIDYAIDKRQFLDAISSILDKLKDAEGKILILLSKIDAIEKLRSYIEANHEGKSIGVYNSTITPEEKIKALDCDIIISTPKSLGTGSDIPGLRFNIMTEPYSSANTANQVAGRLRPYKDKMSIHFEIVDEGFTNVAKMYKGRIKVFKKKCHSITSIKL